MKGWLFIVCLGLLLGTSLFHFVLLDPWINSKAEASSLPTEIRVTVQNGDNLWSIASRYNSINHVSVLDMVDLIMEENHLTKTSIRPGQVLSILIHK
jgi:LysM repeat protein